MLRKRPKKVDLKCVCVCVCVCVYCVDVCSTSESAKEVIIFLMASKDAGICRVNSEISIESNSVKCCTCIPDVWFPSSSQ